MADSTKRYIAADLGLSQGKVLLASVTGGVLTAETVHTFDIPTVRMDGQDYWDIFAAYSELLKGLTVIGSRKLSIESIGIDAWGPGIVCLGRDGRIFGLPCMCGDVLSEAYQAKFFKRMSRRELYEAAGVNVLDSHAALQLFALRRGKSVALDEAKSLLFIPEAIAYLLTGKRFTEYASLSAAGLVDRRSGKISRDVLEACKVRPKRFPSVVQQGARPGKLTEEVAEATGLGRVPVVTVSGHDLASAAAAAPSAGEGSAFLYTGAVSVIGVETVTPVVSDQTFEMNFSNEAGAAGVNLLVKRIAGTDLLGRCLAAWRAAGLAYSPEDVALMAREGAPTAAQLDPEDPALRSVAAAPAAIARYCSLRSMTPPADDAALVRLVYSSLAEKIGDTFLKLQSVTPFRLKALHIVGNGVPIPGSQPSEDGSSASLFVGGASDPVFCQMVADECAVTVTAGPADVAALGNVLVQSGLPRTALSAPVSYTPSL